jgi:hypothetical protein
VTVGLQLLKNFFKRGQAAQRAVDEVIADHNRERCICAAIVMPSGEIIEGRRHFDCLTIIRKRGDYRLDICAAKQGFMTSLGRFVDRQEGMNIQRAAGLPSAFSADGSYISKTDLFSEDLY